MYISQARTHPHGTQKNKLTPNGLKIKYKTWHQRIPRREHRQTFSEINCTKVFLGQSFKAIEIKGKIKGLNQNYKLLYSKGNHKPNEKTAYKMWENICKWSNQEGLNFQNLQRAHTIQQQKTNNSVEPWTEDLNRHF